MRTVDDSREMKQPRSARESRVFMVVVWLCILCLGLPAASQADYAASYSEGLEALAKEQWQEAAEHFTRAVEEQPQAGGKVSAAGKKQLYIPYYHLGLALYRGGALKEASAAWRQSALQGKVKKKLQEEITAYQFDIEAQLAEQSAAVPPPQEAPSPPAVSADEIAARQRSVDRQLVRAERQAKALDSSRLQGVLSQDDSLAALRDQGLEMLQQARQINAMEGARNDVNALKEMHALAVDAAGMLEKVVFSATRLAVQMEREVEGEDGESEIVKPEEVGEAGETEKDGETVDG